MLSELRNLILSDSRYSECSFHYRR